MCELEAFEIANRARRRLIRLSGATLALAALGAHAAAMRPTPSQTSGPFYPADKPLDVDADLTLIKGRTRRAAGQVVHVMGRVLDRAGKPVPGAGIEIWQANAPGRYLHPGDSNPAPLDPNFEGYASIVADEQGRYRFKTIKPGAYPAGNTMRPPHIHFGVTARERRLVTQMYFPDEPRNDKDFVIAGAGADRNLLIAALSPPTADLEPDAWLARWDIVLA